VGRLCLSRGTLFDRIVISLPPLFILDGNAGREGNGGRPRSEQSVGGIVPPPSHAFGGRLSEDAILVSSLLVFNASSKSTRSLHCNSICLSESNSAFSVSDLGE